MCIKEKRTNFLSEVNFTQYLIEYNTKKNVMVYK